MLNVVLLGTGNVATHLFTALNVVESIRVVQVFGRNTKALTYFEQESNITSDPNSIVDADVFLIAVSDGAINPVSQLLHDKKGLVVHTSGAVAMDILSTNRKGVFYPLQTFTKGKKVDFSQIPICIEAKHQYDYEILKNLGKSISNEVCRISSAQREKLHLSAVFANNFTNHLFYLASEICKENNIPFQLMQPLISETINKARFLSPLQAQTGPARRNDVATMQHHLEQLENPLHKKIYQLLSESIKSTYEKKL